MHARGGLQTEYMGEEWFENVEAAIQEADKHGMRPWAYDENGWPSGFGNGKVNGLGVAYQQKYLRMEQVKEHEETAICKSGNHYFYYDINPFYVDTLDKKVTEAFIESTYEPYYERFGNRIEGFFTDEPQISRNGIPWSFVYEDEYKKLYGDNLYEHLEDLFLENDGYKTTRIRFWKMVTALFSENFMKPIYDWCHRHNLKLTGHLVLEESLEAQLTPNGACMPQYEYFDIPGLDWLGRPIFDCLTAKQVSSVADQLGKEAVLAEDFALCGHNVSLAELKGIYEWQMVRGINLLCQHLEGYSLRGIRKRDYPPAMYFQQPWWEEYDKWIEAMSRVGMLLTEGKATADVCVLHPQTTAWTLFDNAKNAGLTELNDRFISILRELEQKHIEFHLGDETILERHGKVENGKLVVGTQTYSYVINCCCDELFESTEKLLKEFVAQGGKIVTPELLKSNEITEDSSITYTKRIYPDFTLHYFVNSSPEEKRVKINVEGSMVDIFTGDVSGFSGVHNFEAWGSLVIFEDGNKNKEYHELAENIIVQDGFYQVDEGTLNTLTLDKCDYYFDGELQEKEGYILNACERANKLERKVALRMEFFAELIEIPEVLYLVTESPEKFRITINGQKIEKNITGYFRDKSFKTIDIRQYVVRGKNTIAYECDFVQSPTFYENLKKAMVFESEKNKLVYDMELESIYLLGNFSVRTDGEWIALEREAYRYIGSFALDRPKKEITLQNIEQQGFPFFCGELTLYGEIEVQGANPVLMVDFKGVNAIRVQIGAFEKVIFTGKKIPLEQVPAGKHRIKLTLINNLRNLLGPHHLEIGEDHEVSPSSFFKEPCVWIKSVSENRWNEDYCFVKMGR